MRDLLEIFQKRGVEFLVVGAHAVNSYTEARLTKDLDLWVNPTPENAARVYAALDEFGAPLDNMSVEAFCDRTSFFLIGTAPNRVDILQNVPGLEFSATWKKRRVLELDGLTVAVPAIEDILAAKVAAGRPQDLLDATKIRKAIELSKRK
jgi:hypothetical protein